MVNAAMTLISDCVRNDTDIVDQADLAEEGRDEQPPACAVAIERFEAVAVDIGDIIDWSKAALPEAADGPLNGRTRASTAADVFGGVANQAEHGRRPGALVGAQQRISGRHCQAVALPDGRMADDLDWKAEIGRQIGRASCRERV